MRMKKVLPTIMCLATMILELLPYGAVCIFATGPEAGDEIRNTFSYFSLIPYGYANFGPFLTAILTCVLLLLSLVYLFMKKDKVLNVMKSISIAAVITSLMPLMYGIRFYSIIGFLITLTLIVYGVWAGKELGTSKK